MASALLPHRDDVDARHQLLRIIASKFGKSREVALHHPALTAGAREVQSPEAVATRERV